MLPLAAIIFGIVAVLTPTVDTVRLPEQWSLGGAGVAAVVAIVVGAALAGQGDEESGRLELPGLQAQPTAASGTTPEAGGGGGAIGTTLTVADVSDAVYTVVAGESKLTYTVREKLANLPSSSDAVGSTTELSGEVRLDGVSTISADASTLTSNQDRRDNRIRQGIFNEDPIVTFTLEAPELPESYAAGEVFTGEVTGTATIRGVSRPLTFAIEAQTDGETLQIVGRTDFTWADFEITPPNVGGLVEVEDNVHIEVLVVARRAGV
ncbi:MAG: YceI family protein [Dehalococcoidia bacterium]